MNHQVLFVGQGPSQHGDPWKPLEGIVAVRLAELLGIHPVNFIKKYARINLNTEWIGKAGKGDVFDVVEGRRAAKNLLMGSWTHYVLLGRNVADCFGLEIDEPLQMFCAEGADKHYLLLPHPSGINRWWNDPEHRKAAAWALKSFLH